MLLVLLPFESYVLSYPRMIILVAGGLALLPIVVHRWRHMGPSPTQWILGGVTLAFVAWNAVSSIASDLPLASTIFGSTTRGVGVLAVTCVAVLLLGAATLTMEQVFRVVTWLLGAGTAMAVVGLAQAANIAFTTSSGVVGTLVNTNFAAAAYAILAVLAVGRAASPLRWQHRAWAGALAVVLALLTWFTDSRQGPAALGAGLVALVTLAAVAYRGPRRRIYLSGVGITLVAAGALLIASFAKIGPLTWLWSEWTFAARWEYWRTALDVALAHPVFGVGPDGLGYVSAQYWTEELAAIHGPDVQLGMAHNLALQYASTLGWVGFGVWTALFIGIGVALAIRIVRGPVRQSALTSSVGAALATYLIQGMVSLDVLALISLGWLIAGMALALANERDSGATPITSTSRRLRLSGYGLAAIGLGAIMFQLSAPGLTSPVATPEARARAAQSLLTPCEARLVALELAIREDPADVAQETARGAFALNARCPRIPRLTARASLAQGDLSLADAATQAAVREAPLESESWGLRGRYLLAIGDTEGARSALVEAVRLNALYPSWKMADQVSILQQELARLD